MKCINIHLTCILYIWYNVVRIRRKGDNPQMDEWIDTLLKIAGLLDAMFFVAYAIQKIIDLFRGGRK